VHVALSGCRLHDITTIKQYTRTWLAQKCCIVLVLGSFKFDQTWQRSAAHNVEKIVQCGFVNTLGCIFGLIGVRGAATSGNCSHLPTYQQE